MNTPTMQLMSWADEQGPHVARDLANAITLAQRVHRGQYRRSGDPYITHPIAVALILAEHGADPMTVITAVLHDLEDVSAQDAAMGFTSDTALRATFGHAIVDLLFEFTAFDRSGPIPPPESTDRRVLAIKVADRLHNMCTISCLHPEVQRLKADQPSTVVAPLARQLGLTAIGDELDTLSAATLRAHEESQQLAPLATVVPRTVSVRALHSTPRAAVRVLSPRPLPRTLDPGMGRRTLRRSRPSGTTPLRHRRPSRATDHGRPDPANEPAMTIVAGAGAGAIIGVILLGLALAALADRSARATAWRQIALERRWNHEHHPDIDNHIRD